MIFIAVRKNVQHNAVLWVDKDAVILFAAGVSFEFIQRNDLRKIGQFLVEEIEIAHGGNG